jgi:hypothetical protein
MPSAMPDMIMMAAREAMKHIISFIHVANTKESNS